MTGVNIKAETDGWTFEPSPCESCPNAALCRGGMTCAAFLSFVTFGGRQWSAEGREPDRVIFARLFGDGS
jgi:hypothetical protein